MLANQMPLWSPRWQYADGLLQYKPYPRYPTWLIAWDLSEILVAIEYVGTVASEAGIAAIAAQTDATTALANAATAQAAADAAQADADAALAAAGAIVTGFPSQHFILPNTLHTITAGFTLQTGVNASAALNVLYLMSGLNSEASFIVGVPAGNYIVRMVGERYNGGADCRLQVDGTTISTNNFYNATAVHAYEVVYVVNSLTTGLHTFTLKITGRQPGNTTAYNLFLSYITVSPNP